ncbi:hypothetical protein CSUI_007409 [Cystoisospora suis]|uniref:Uncharacterized protein n=1 Tax=Cystoisospora suis TaxID=483139 RepID=A0A2C6KQP9_9APIC|nr:hypothetical protein CSUI_007409 [Cystoisospora suis]
MCVTQAIGLSLLNLGGGSSCAPAISIGMSPPG